MKTFSGFFPLRLYFFGGRGGGAKKPDPPDSGFKTVMVPIRLSSLDPPSPPPALPCLDGWVGGWMVRSKVS